MIGTADLIKTIRRVTRNYTENFVLGGTLAAQDYVGDTSADDGVPMPQGTLDEARVTLASADDGNTEITLENEDSGTTYAFTLDADTYTEETGIDLYFSEGDRLSVSVTSVTTPGTNANLTVKHEIDNSPMN